MSTLFEKQSTTPKPYLATIVPISSNQEYDYINEKLDNEKKIADQIDELATNFEKINNEIQDVICNHHQLKDTVHQNHKETLLKINQQARRNQYLTRQIRQRKTDDTLIMAQLNNLKENSHKLREDIRHLESGMTDQIDKFAYELDQHEVAHNLFTDQLNNQQDNVQKLTEQIIQTKSELSPSLKSIEKTTNSMKRMIREHQILKTIVDSTILYQNILNEEFKKHLNQSQFEQGTSTISDQSNSSKPVQADTERIQILSNQFPSNSESLEEVNEHLEKTEQLPINSELIQYPLALFLNILPPNYPAESIFINGKRERVTAFLSVNNQEQIAIFLEDENVKKYDYRIIEGITLGEEW